MEETHPEAAAILAGAGWKPHDEWHVFTRGALVMGFEPSGLSFHVKNTARCADGPDTPDDPVEAARWLVARFPANPLTTEATLAPLSVDAVGEEAETPAHETHGETGEEADTQSPVGGDAAQPGEGNDADGISLSRADGVTDYEHSAGGADDAIDADFTDFGESDAAVEGDSLDLGEVEDYRRDPLLIEGEAEAPATEEPESGAQFIFGDNLAADRIMRIGQLSEHANTLIDAARFGYDEEEHNRVRNHVVTNMNESGVYVGGDQTQFDRFIALEGVVTHIRAIEAYRDRQQDYIRSASHEEVAAFDPEFGWP